MLHELQVQQIELEMKNEELRASREERSWRRPGLAISSPTIWHRWATAPSQNKAWILEANLTAATPLGVAQGALVK